jgi:hypothetical protein
VTASEILLAVAANAERRSDNTGTGRYLFVESQGWYLNTTVAAGVGRSMIVAVHRRQWKAADGSGRIMSVWGKTLHDDGHEEDDEFGPGGLHLRWWPDTLSSNPGELRHQLMVGQRDDTPARVLKAVKELYDEQPVAPVVAAAALRIVADLPGLHLDETAAEPGVRISLSSDEDDSSWRYVLVFDEDTGLLISSEEVLTRSTGHLANSVPCVVSRKIYLNAARTNARA